MANINVRQNESQSIDKIAAARQIYSDIKIRLKILRFFSVYLCILLAFISLGLSNEWIVGALGINQKIDISAPVAIFGAVMTLIEIFVFDWTSRSRELAAKIQESFDCYVFDMQWNQIIVGQQPAHAQIYEYSNKHKKKAKNFIALNDWYNVLTATVNESIGTLLCQSMNLEWDNSLRARLQNQIKLVSILMFFAVLIPNLFMDFSIKGILINVFCPLLPFIVFNLNLHLNNKSCMENVEHCINAFNSLWDEIVNQSISMNQLRVRTRDLQNLIYNHRRTASNISDGLYWKHKTQNEASATYTIDQLIRQLP